MSIIVQKFGGTSVATLERMKSVQKKVMAARAKGYKVLVVLSAMAGETNRLLALANEWSANPDPAETDVLVATGEQCSIALFAMLLKDSGVKARSLLAHQIPIYTDDSYGRARIHGIESGTLENLFNHYDVLVAAGFQGKDHKGRITTLGRGGSDTSAVALASALGSVECEIYTDVEGVYTTDPNMCKDARKISHISYDEMLEMASMGAKVLEIRSVEFAKKYDVPVHVRSTFSDNVGTLVTKENKIMEHVLVSSIAYDKDQARVTLRSVPDTPGVAAKIFSPLADAGIVVDMIVQNPSRDGVTDMTFTTPRKDIKKTIAIAEDICKKLGGNAELTYDLNVAKVSAIGVGMRNHSGVAAIAFAALQKENINIMMISTSEIKISILIEEKYIELAVRTLHDMFIGTADKIVCDETNYN
ncbi:aspartate kinase [Desulfovibrio litoralis]|uniref:Aspartokinase n=1 Tax=Desulfovibrio litoralis DSM 11393 TaxID=1121455 RepID=A0A1M7RTP4_9BACT|nr:aspartate kinase [Desulfovibrio litoralis]SHN49574.1 aspartate kinase [Desulfovibrio litoralis DSM 11393]